MPRLPPLALAWVGLLGVACRLATSPAAFLDAGLEEPTPSDRLHAAVRDGDLEQTKRLIEAGVPVDTRNALGSTPLQDAAWNGNREIAAFLIAHGADINARHPEAGSTALYYAIATGHADMVELLLHSGADPSLRYRGGQLALHLAAGRGNAQVLGALLKAAYELPVAQTAGGETRRETGMPGTSSPVDVTGVSVPLDIDAPDAR